MNQHKTDILLVEDNIDDAGLVIRALRKNDPALPVLHLNNGEEALQFLYPENGEAPRDLPRLILLDLKMPKVDGLGLLSRIKSDERTRAIPVVMLTSSNQNSDITSCYRMGANSYIVKPVDFGDFVRVVSGISQYWLHLNHCPQMEKNNS